MDMFKEDRERCWNCHEKEIWVECDYCGDWVCQECALKWEGWSFGTAALYCKSCYEKHIAKFVMWPGGTSG